MNWHDKLTIGVGYTSAPITVTQDEFSNDSVLSDWLIKQASSYALLLAHADDGVIWGFVDNNTLHLSSAADNKISPALRVATLQQLWLFDENSQIHLWSDGINWHANRVSETEEDDAASLDEQHILWGTLVKNKGDFTLLEDGSQGLRHLIPKPIGDISHGESGEILRERMYLHIRHYLTSDENGINSISMSRLVGIGQLNHG